jgi:hypothetical protein
MNWIKPVQDTNKWQADVHKWMNLRISHYRNDKNDDNFVHQTTNDVSIDIIIFVTVWACNGMLQVE